MDSNWVRRLPVEPPQKIKRLPLWIPRSAVVLVSSPRPDLRACRMELDARYRFSFSPGQRQISLLGGDFGASAFRAGADRFRRCGARPLRGRSVSDPAAA